MSLALCHTPYGDFQLAPFPARHREQLKGWCAADLLLLESAAALGLQGSALLVVNDAHGALCCALQPLAHWTDSKLSQRAMLRNQQRNGLLATPVVWSVDDPPAASVAVMRIPKQLDYLVYQLQALGRALPEGALLLAAGMDKHLSPRSAELIERYFGPTQRHRGQKKARVFSARNSRSGSSAHDSDPDHAAAAGSVEATAQYLCEPAGGVLTSRPNVFSGQGLDQGSRLLLQHLHRVHPAQVCIDLACGNGVLGLAAFRQKLAQRVLFCDESALAVACARDNARRLYDHERDAFDFVHADGLNTITRASAQLVLCNPPFHRGHTLDTFTGQRLVRQCARHLPANGQLLMVTNNHLPYLPLLRRHFTHAERVGADRRYDVLLARQ